MLADPRTPRPSGADGGAKLLERGRAGPEPPRRGLPFPGPGRFPNEADDFDPREERFPDCLLLEADPGLRGGRGGIDDDPVTSQRPRNSARRRRK